MEALASLISTFCDVEMCSALAAMLLLGSDFNAITMISYSFL